MKSLIYIFLSAALILSSCSNGPINPAPKNDYSLIPRPQKLIPSEGALYISEGFVVKAAPELESAQQLLTSFLENRVGLMPTGNSAGIAFDLRLDTAHSLKNEGYLLEINQDGAALSSNTAEGIHRGMATLKQLILLQMKDGSAFLPFVKIDDWASFKHRGLLLDCSRHFFEVEVIKKYIDLLAFYKMNTLHWHLTEDQGWRIDIEKYPKLTEVGAYRTELDGSAYGGYYSKEEIKEIVAYASAQHIELIPEIELPGHSQAAIAAYPHLSCKGEPVEVANDWGVFKEIYCAGNDSVFVFLEDVLTEIMELFPSQYIHIGGDEAPKLRWEQCEKCQRRIKNEGLADEAELQSYFIQRIQRFLKENGKQIIGWDEILEGGLAEGAIVQSWRGMEGGVEAVRHGNQAIMSPTSHAYFDYGLDAIDLEKVYSFNPIPHGLTSSEQELIIGRECNMWTERVPDEKTLDSHVFPRLLAMAEVLWSDSAERDFSEFTNRVQSHYPILEKYQVQYGRESVPMSHEMELDGGVAYLRLIPYSDAISLKYHYDCPNCEATETEYSSLIPIQKSGTIGIQPYKDEQPYGDSIFIPVSQHHAVNAQVTYRSKFSEWYTAGGKNGLADGKLGTLNFRDGSWQGFRGSDVNCTLQLYAPTEISSVTAHFYQYNNSWIFIPIEMSVEVSTDAENWKTWGSIEGKNDPKKRGQFIIPMTITGIMTEPVTFMRFTAKNLGTVPDWHEAAGSDAWIFIDEIIVE